MFLNIDNNSGKNDDEGHLELKQAKSSSKQCTLQCIIYVTLWYALDPAYSLKHAYKHSSNFH